MRVVTLVLNSGGQLCFQGKDCYDKDRFAQLLKSGEELTRNAGKKVAIDGVPDLAKDLVLAVLQGDQGDITEAVANLALSTCLIDVVFGGLNPDVLNRLDLRFVVRQDGAVSRSYVPIGHTNLM